MGGVDMVSSGQILDSFIGFGLLYQLLRTFPAIDRRAVQIGFAISKDSLKIHMALLTTPRAAVINIVTLDVQPGSFVLQIKHCVTPFLWYIVLWMRPWFLLGVRIMDFVDTLLPKRACP